MDYLFEDVFGMMSVYERVGDRERRMGGKREREREREAGWLAFQQFPAFFESPYTNLFLAVTHRVLDFFPLIQGDPPKKLHRYRGESVQSFWL